MDDLVERLRAIGEEEMYQAPATTKATIDEAADRIEQLQRQLAEAERHLSRVLYLYSGAWHPDSIFQQEYGHEIEAARTAIRERTD